MKRALVLTALIAVAAVVVALAYRAAARDRGYRTLIESGEAALASDDTLAAVEDFSGAIALRPDAMLARLRRGETYSRRGDYDVAARDFRAAAALDPTATRPLESLGDVLFAQERYKRAAETFEARLALDDRSALIRYKLALARYRDGQIDAALADARSALLLDDRLADAHYLAALCLRDQGHPDQAVTMLKGAVERGPGLVAAREELADLYAASGRYADQLEQLQVLAGLDSRRAERQVAIGLAQATAGKMDLAVATLSAALEQAPDQSPVNAALGRVWLQIAEDRRDRPEALGKALEALERAASALSATSDTKALYGRALALSGQKEAAEQLFQQAIERYPLDPSAFRQLASVSEQLGHADIARSALIDYVALTQPDRDAAEHAERIGLLSLKVGDWSGAVQWLQKALAERPNDMPLLTALADAQFEAGDLSSARVAVTRAQLLDPLNRQIVLLDRKLKKAGS
ncbi:MAG: tetratricopeptide repeat protein [Vicinamibacterales bacterium]